jgi:hypothetical protein
MPDKIKSIFGEYGQLVGAITETEEARRGALLAEVFMLKSSKIHPDRWLTEWGSKTNLGLYRLAERIVKDGE